MAKPDVMKASPGYCSAFASTIGTDNSKSESVTTAQ